MDPVLILMLAGGPVLNAVLVLIGLRMFRLKVTPAALRDEFTVHFAEYQERVDHRFAYLDRQLARLAHFEARLTEIPKEIHTLTTAVQALSGQVATLKAGRP